MLLARSFVALAQHARNAYGDGLSARCAHVQTQPLDALGKTQHEIYGIGGSYVAVSRCEGETAVPCTQWRRMANWR